MKEPKYIVTAVNNLTGEREAISRPHSRWKTEELLTRARRNHVKHPQHACYSLLRMELAVPPPLISTTTKCNDCKSVLDNVYFSIPA